MHSSYPRGMCLFTSARTVAMVFARSAGSEAMYCAGVLTFDAGFMGSSSSQRSVSTNISRMAQANFDSLLQTNPREQGKANTYHGDTEARRRREIVGQSR